MNGTHAKKLRRQHAARYTEDGLPRDAKEWTEEDWKSLNAAMERVKREIAERHTKARG